MGDGEAEMLGNTDNIQDALIFCPNMGIIQMDKILEDTKNSICNKFTTIMFEEKDSIKSKLQLMKEYLEDAESNQKVYNSPMYVTGIFSYEKDAPIENWLLNSVES